jgi:hypothetical protein
MAAPQTLACFMPNENIDYPPYVKVFARCPLFMPAG